ncbi:hypothetical protein DFH06DRAFT_1176459 [Mycena polygramma]|nr:hypothetical protein DFH06DRAFT_1176459 [Mycena polygramma]
MGAAKQRLPNPLDVRESNIRLIELEGAICLPAAKGSVLKDRSRGVDTSCRSTRRRFAGTSGRHWKYENRISGALSSKAPTCLPAAKFSRLKRSLQEDDISCQSTGRRCAAPPQHTAQICRGPDALRLEAAHACRRPKQCEKGEPDVGLAGCC